MEIRYLRQPLKFIKLANSGLKEKIKSEVLKISCNPYDNPQLHFQLKGIYSNHFSYQGIQYRIAYKIENNILIIIIAIGSRENFYQKLVVRI